MIIFLQNYIQLLYSAPIYYGQPGFLKISTSVHFLARPFLHTLLHVSHVFIM